MAFAAPGVGMLGFMPPQPQQSAPLTPEILAAKARPRGLLGNIGAFIGSPQGSQFFRSLGAVAHDIGHGTNTFNDLMAQLEEQRRQMLQDAWMRQQQDRVRMQWKAEDQQHQAAQSWANSLPAGPQHDAAVANPDAAYSAYMPQLFQPQDTPLTDEQMTQYHLRPGTSAVMRNGRVDILQNPVQPTGGSGGGNSFSAFGLEQSDIEDMGRIVGLTGMPVGDVTGSRDRRINGPVMGAAMETRRRMNLSPETFAQIRNAYLGDRHSRQALQTTRDQVAANEGAARSALGNVATLLRGSREQGIAPLPRSQISSIPSGNDALQAYNRTLGGNGPLAAYVGAIITARTEYARVISGSNSPPVEAMHEAERVLPTNITPQQLDAVSQNLQREMEFRTQAFDSVLSDIDQRTGLGQNAPPAGGNAPARPANVPPNAVWDGHMWRLP